MNRKKKFFYNAMEKWARDVKGCFTEKGIQMPLPDVILCSNLFI